MRQRIENRSSAVNGARRVERIDDNRPARCSGIDDRLRSCRHRGR